MHFKIKGPAIVLIAFPSWCQCALEYDLGSPA